MAGVEDGAGGDDPVRVGVGGVWCECYFERAGAVENVQMRPNSRPLYGQTARKLLYYSIT